MGPDQVEIHAPPVVGPLSDRAEQISGKSFVPKNAKPLPMLKEDRECLTANGEIKAEHGWEKCPK